VSNPTRADLEPGFRSCRPVGLFRVAFFAWARVCSERIGSNRYLPCGFCITGKYGENVEIIWAFSEDLPCRLKKAENASKEKENRKGAKSSER
jgi:hypothetical protein